MEKATRTVISTFGVLAGLAAIEHGIGEALQGNVAPGALVFASWPGSAFFRIVGGEPAMTIVPNLLFTGILAIIAGLAFAVCAALLTWQVPRGPVLILLSIVMLLVGGGFGPPLLGLILGTAATRVNTPLASRHSRLAVGFQYVLRQLWPWSFGLCLIAWLLMFPGTAILGYFFGVTDPNLVVLLVFVAFGLMLVTIFAARANDEEERNLAYRFVY